MFDLENEIDAYRKSALFYEYAKSLAILRENFHRFPRTAKDGDILNKINNAIEILIKQVQE